MAKDIVSIKGNINKENLKMYKMFKVHNQLKGLSPKTLKIYEYDLYQWFRFLDSYQADKLYNEVTEEDIEEYIMFCKSGGNEASRLHSRISAISSFYLFLRRKKKVDYNPIEFIERPRKKVFVREKHFLKQDQVDDIKKNLYKFNDIIGETFVLLALNTAARKNALRNIKWSDIDWDEREIYAIEKGPKEVTLYFSNELKEQLLKLKKYYENNNINLPYVFVSYYHGKHRQAGDSIAAKWIREAGKLIGIQNLAPHSCRRTAATLMLNAGMELIDVSAVLNHENMDTTKIYVQRDKKKLKSIKDKICI